MKYAEKIRRVVLLAAVAVGILTYALFTAAEIASLTILFPALIAIGSAGLFTLLLAAVRSCECSGFNFCTNGILAAFGGGGTVIAALLTALAGSGAATAYRVGTAISLALLTLLLGGIIGYLAEQMDCFRRGCGCASANAFSDEADCSSCKGYDRR